MWRSAPAAALLHHDEVHVWRARLDIEARHLVEYQSGLSSDEAARAQQFDNPVDRRRFIVRRGILRRLLGMYVGIRPAAVQLKYTAYGQPWLCLRDQRHSLRFSLSHVSDRALYAVSL